jgi:D-alanyl-D-alanine carboxypeptidase/D-alanyl-D-alanine-endopeptidase (penicillin-binding protein 4)
MRKRLIFGFWMLLSTTLLAQTESIVNEIDSFAIPVEQQLPWPQCVQSRLDSMMRDPLFDNTQLGLMVWDLTDDCPLFSFNKQQLMRPASTMKLLTAITALDRLGGNYQYRTSLYYNGEIVGRTLLGDLYCVGGMDPAFDVDDLRLFADALKQVGVDTISGTIVTDISMKDTLKWGEGWCWDDDNPDLSPLLVGRKADFVQHFCNALVEADICLDDVMTTNGVLPSDAVLVCERKRSIDYILQRMMKDSDNLYAESMFYQTGASSHRPARANDAARVARALIERAGLNSSHYRIADGSGLSLYNYLSAELEVRILRYTYQHQDIYSHLLPSLPIAGEDGTLKKRMKNTSAAGNVQAKTGTVTGVSSLAGYCTASNGHRLCFSIMNQGIEKSSDGRAFQDKICMILCD